MLYLLHANPQLWAWMRRDPDGLWLTWPWLVCLFIFPGLLLALFLYEMEGCILSYKTLALQTAILTVVAGGVCFGLTRIYPRWNHPNEYAQTESYRRHEAFERTIFNEESPRLHKYELSGLEQKQEPLHWTMGMTVKLILSMAIFLGLPICVIAYLVKMVLTDDRQIGDILDRDFKKR